MADRRGRHVEFARGLFHGHVPCRRLKCAQCVQRDGGSLDLTIGNETITLDEGNSMYFDPSFPHSYCQKGKHKCCAVVVVTS